MSVAGSANAVKTTKTKGAELWAFILVFLILSMLIGAILLTNANTNRTINNLQENTLEAAYAFRMNAILQQVVNQTNQVDFNLRKKIIQNDDIATAALVEDTLRTIRRNLNELQELHFQLKLEESEKDHFFRLMNQRLGMVDTLLSDFQDRKRTGSVFLSERERQLNDSIYTYALQIQAGLENDLSSNMQAGISNSHTVGATNRLFSMIVVIAFAVLGTILLYRLLKHDKIMRELQLSKIKTEQLAKAKDDFLANMSHEIRTPLHAIMGYTELLKVGKLDKKQRQQVEILNNAGSQLYSVVNDILDVAKLEDGKLRIENKPFNLRLLFAELESIFNQSAKENGIGLIVRVDRAIPPRLLGDPVRIRQILYNLLGNSIKFTETGHVKLLASLKENYAQTSKVCFEVIDTGIGIDPKYHQSIFNRFEQVPGSPVEERLPATKGTGLGLSIVKGLVSLLEGEISVQSQPGAGTHFQVVLPLPVATEQSGATSEEIQEEFYDFSKIRVLIVEDNEVNQLFLELLMEKWKVNWAIVENGRQAVELLELDNGFDLVFMDLRMPEMSGEEALLYMQEKGLKTMPVIAMTAHAFSSDDYTLSNFGFDDWLNKPFNAHMFAEKIKIHLPDEKRSIARPASSNTDADFKHNSGEIPPELQSRLFAIFAKSFPDSLEKLRHSIDGMDRPQAREVAHVLTGSLAAFGSRSTALERLNDLRDALKKEDNDEEVIAKWKIFEAAAGHALSYAKKHAAHTHT